MIGFPHTKFNRMLHGFLPGHLVILFKQLGFRGKQNDLRIQNSLFSPPHVHNQNAPSSIAVELKLIILTLI